MEVSLFTDFARRRVCLLFVDQLRADAQLVKINWQNLSPPLLINVQVAANAARR